ncbi:tetratricopeptide repeat protein [Pseudobutyrivibrio ruminis]|uniref:Uncharacterized protein n=1 Tax=Pseudobutyrivibrio ruminis DSM 9787 TaxID=1123011 RepID=A0A285SQI2_9FIRM|nr:hypothetical protein [Pseudobutyrivibrio ruminis]SOC10207.1 hypothetical protein SAMN02910411_2618 [Pseudobutyrivibrio ruminis DSM 9787]
MEKNAGYYFTLAEVALKAANYDEALGYMETGREIDPNFMDWDLYEIYIWFNREDYYTVAELCHNYYEKDDQNVKVLEIWQEACEYLEWYKDVVGIGYAAIDLNTDNPEVYARNARAYALYNQYRDAIDCLEEVVDKYPELNMDLEKLYYDLVTDDGHGGMEDATKSIEYAEKARSLGEFDWRMEYRDINMRMYIGDNDNAIKVAEEAIEKLKDVELDEDDAAMNPDLVFKWLIGKNMLLKREDHFCMPLDKEKTRAAAENLKQTFEESMARNELDTQGCTLENLYTCYRLLGEYDEGIQFMTEAESKMDEDTKEALSDTINRLTGRLYVLKKDYAKARECILKDIKSIDLSQYHDYESDKMVTAENLNEFKRININPEVDRLRDVLVTLVEMPELFTQEEREKSINDLLEFIEKVVELNLDGMDVMIPFVGHAIHYSPAVTTDYERLYKIINSKFMKKMFANATEYYRDMYYKNLMRICAFMQKDNESKAYAKSYLNLINDKKYCIDKKVSFDEACKVARISNRIDIAALGTAYLYMGKIEDAKNTLLLMMMNPVCWFCDKSGCLEYYLLKAEIDIAEGNYEEAQKYLDEVEKTEWNNHEEIAASLKLYLKSKNLV